MKIKIVTLFKLISTLDGWEIVSCDCKVTPKYYKPLIRKAGFTMSQILKDQLEWKGFAFTPGGAIEIKLSHARERVEELMVSVGLVTQRVVELEKLQDAAEEKKVKGNSGTFLTASLEKEGDLERALELFKKRYGGIPQTARINPKGQDTIVAVLQGLGLAEIEFDTSHSGGIFVNEIWFETPREE